MHARAALLALLVGAAACPRSPRLAEPTGPARLREELERADRVASRGDAPAADRVRAWIRGARACEQLHDEAGARARLELAVRSEIAGASEPAMFFLATRLEVDDRARALNLYYRAAAGAQKNLGGGFPYHEAMDRILHLSMER